MKKILFAAMAASLFFAASCSKDEKDDVKKDPIKVSDPVIDPTCMDMYLYENLEPNIISWSEPEVSGDTKVKFDYQFMISEDDGATWKAFERQEQTSVAIKKDYRYKETSKQYTPYLHHNPLPDSKDIPLNYLDSLNEDIKYMYRIRAYYTAENTEEAYVTSAVGRFVVDGDFTKAVIIKNNQMNLRWDCPKSNLKKVVVLYTKEFVIDYNRIISGEAQIDDFYKDNYYKELSPDVTSASLDKPDPKYDFDGCYIVFCGIKDGQVQINRNLWPVGLNNIKWK